MEGHSLESDQLLLFWWLTNAPRLPKILWIAIISSDLMLIQPKIAYQGLSLDTYFSVCSAEDRSV